MKSIPNGGGCTVYSLGRIGITEVRLWLGIDVSPNNTKNIEKAINLLESNDYTVTKNA